MNETQYQLWNIKNILEVELKSKVGQDSFKLFDTPMGIQFYEKNLNINTSLWNLY